MWNVAAVIAGVFSGALLASGCGHYARLRSTPRRPDACRSRPSGDFGPPGETGNRAADILSIPVESRYCADRLPAAGGGRPRTGYLGFAAALYFASNKDLSRPGWGVDLNYVHNITGEFSVEGALGLVGYDLDAATETGAFRALTFAAAAQYGRPFGTSRWYVGAGAGYWLSVGEVDADDAPACIVSGGVEFELSGHASLDLEFRYTFARSGLSGGDDLDLDAFAARVNYIFVF